MRVAKAIVLTEAERVTLRADLEACGFLELAAL